MEKTMILLLCMMGFFMQGKAQYRIVGNVTDVPDGARLYLTLVGPPNETIDSTTIQGGKFEFKGTHRGKPEWAIIRIEHNFVSLADFYLEDGTIRINGPRYGTWATGTPTNEQYNEYNDSINKLFSDITSLTYQRAMKENMNKRATDSINAEIKKVEQTAEGREERFLRRYPSSPIAARVVDYRSRFATSARIMRLLSLLSPALQQEPAMLKVKDYAFRLAKTENDAQAPLFTLPTDKGTSVSLADYRGKYVLIDFWASWCAPCRGSFPAIAKLYRQYHSARFDIIGVSLDRSEAAWRKAVKEESVPWTQVLDQKGTVASNYAVSAIPHLVLISPDGKIISTYNKADLNEELDNLLQKK